MILAYCLMSNHVHLLIKPKENDSLYKMMQGVTLCYTQFTNRKYSRTGRLWESRYHSCIVDKDSYLWAVARYIETNPVMCPDGEKAEDYAYSSALAHIMGKTRRPFKRGAYCSYTEKGLQGVYQRNERRERQGLDTLSYEDRQAAGR